MAPESYHSLLSVRLVLYPLREPPHSGMIFKRLHGVVAPFEVRIADGDVDISVAGAAQSDRPTWVAPLELLAALPTALHLPGAGAGQEVVAGETVFPDAPAAHLTPALGAKCKLIFACHHSEIIRADLPTSRRSCGFGWDSCG